MAKKGKKSVLETSAKKAKDKALETGSDKSIVELKKLNLDGEVGQVFNLPFNESLVSQYIRVYRFNQRLGLAKAKTRAEVSGSGRKPWRQKHTGRARVGSIRNPLWRHGGVAHGPVLRDWSLKMSKKMKSKAFATIFSQKLKLGEIYETENIDLTEGRSKELVELLNGWGLKGKTLLVLDKVKEKVKKASANLKNVSVAVCDNLNGYQLLENNYVIIESSALGNLIKRYAKNK